MAGTLTQIRRSLAPTLLAALATAQGAPSLLTDIHTVRSQIGGFSPSARAAQLNGRLIMTAVDGNHGAELWSSDGTAAGTGIVRDITPGPRASSPDHLVALGGFVYFSADDGARGRELWRTDGTTAGTTLVEDIYSGPTSSDPQALAVIAGVLYFSAETSANGRELWRSDGTAAGTLLVEDINPGANDGLLATGAIVAGRHLIAGTPLTVALFTADDGVSGLELWESRGTAASTVRRADINPGSGDSVPSRLTAFSGHVMFRASNGTNGIEPYHIRDGAPVMIADLNTGSASSNPDDFTPIPISGSPRFFFAATNANYGREVFFWDTAASAGSLLEDIQPGTSGSDPELLAVGGFLLISADHTSFGRELWRSDAALTGATLLRDIRPARGQGSNAVLCGVLSGSPPRALFAADDGVTGFEAWVTDGTSAGTVLLIDMTLPNNNTTPFLVGPLPTGQTLYGKSPGGSGTLWPLVTDGTPAGTSVFHVPAGSSLPSDPEGWVVLGTPPRVLFAATNASNGRELWISDGSTAGTGLLEDIAPGSAHSSPAGLMTAGGRCYFTATDGSTGVEPWVSDGTAAGTFRLRDIRPGASGSMPGNFLEAGGVVYFWADDGSRGIELWRTDGTTAGTTLVTDLAPGVDNGVFNGAPLGRVGNRVLFWSHANAAVGNEPWVSNGTAAGTTLLKDIEPGSGDSLSLQFGESFAFGGVTYFRANTTATGTELWRTDGTPGGTNLVMDLLAGTGGSTPRGFCSFGGSVYFLATGSNSTVIWNTFGTAGTTAQVRSFTRPPGGLLPADSVVALTPVNSRLVFAAWDSTHGFEPWTTDGSFGGTVLLQDLVPGVQSGLPLQPTPDSALRPEAWFFSLPGAGRFLFPGTSGGDGVEIWRSDGTAAGTVRHAEIAAGPAGSRPRAPVLVGNQLLFAAVDALLGNEPFRMASMGHSAPFGLGCQGSNGRIPSVAGSGAPFVGNAGYGVQVSSARASAATILLIGFGPLDVPIGGGCSLYLDLAIPPIVLTGSTGPTGFGVVGLPIPADQNLIGLQMWAQMDVVDPGAAFQGLLAISGGLHIVVGPN